MDETLQPTEAPHSSGEASGLDTATEAANQRAADKTKEALKVLGDVASRSKEVHVDGNGNVLTPREVAEHREGVR